jgi:hypothetical protein
MMSTGPVNPAGLARGAGLLSAAGSGKLGDVAIRSLCTEQYKVVQMGSSLGPLYCEFDDISRYGDDQFYMGKDCSQTYSPTGNYPAISWRQGRSFPYGHGFSTYGSIAGATITQQKYGNAKKSGSPKCHSCTSTDGQCSTTSDRCHVQVWCRAQRVKPVGGWTLVYKIADTSTMMSTGAVNIAGLSRANLRLPHADGALQSSASAKLSDAAIRALCTEQYRVVQMGSGKLLHCSFDDVSQYGDATLYAGKDCGRGFRSSGEYADVSWPSNWSYGFSTWGSIMGATITQQRYGDAGRNGSSTCYNCTNHRDGGCRSDGGCHVQIFCRSHPRGMGSCNACPAGSHACASCPPGKFSAHPALPCAVCPPGSITDTLTGYYASNCIMCAAGQFSPTPTTPCSACSLGFTSSNGSSLCTACAAGQYRNSSTTECVQCAAGRYQPNAAMIDCTDCPLGSSSSNGSSSCTACASGQFRNSSTIGCVQCAAGRYQPNAGMTNCSACPAGSTTIQVQLRSVSRTQSASNLSSSSSSFSSSSPSSSSWSSSWAAPPSQPVNITVTTTVMVFDPTACVPCAVGRYGNLSTAPCSLCAAGRYQQQTGMTSCSVCHPGAVAEVGAGMGVVSSGAASCTACPPASPRSARRHRARMRARSPLVLRLYTPLSTHHRFTWPDYPDWGCLTLGCPG